MRSSFPLRGVFASASRWRSAIVCIALVSLVVALPFAVRAEQDFGQKNLQGKVFDGKDAPIKGAIVYLQNSRTSDVKTFISGDDGSYRFAALSADTDYTVWAAFQGKKSPSKTISSFDTRKLVFVDLKIK
jgi:hypothetical protein